MKASLTTPEDTARYVAELSRQGIAPRTIQHAADSFTVFSPPYPVFMPRGIDEAPETRAFPTRHDLDRT